MGGYLNFNFIETGLKISSTVGRYLETESFEYLFQIIFKEGKLPCKYTYADNTERPYDGHG